MSKIEKRLEELGVQLPEAPSARGNYKPSMQIGDFVYTSGASCVIDGEIVYHGRLGTDLTIEEGYDAAKITALNLLSMLKAELGDLDRITQIVKLLGFVSSAPDFYDQPKVINGASDFLVEVFGEKGKHTRSALGTSVLPFNIPVEIEMIVKVE